MAKDKRKKGGRTLAQKADRYELYEKSVQEPEADISLIRRVFKKHTGRAARSLREDFCGTAVFACDWVKQHKENQAWAIDLDPVPLDWGRQNRVSQLKPSQQARLKLIEGNVLDVGHEPVDVTCAFNFSYFLFSTREELRHYFEMAYATLVDDGVLMLDAYGGAESMITSEERRKVGGVTYVWDQHKFDPIHHRVTNYIHFDFKDGSRLRRAFRYDWRLWTLPEIRERLAEAGFRKAQILWEGTDDEGEGNGVYRPKESAEDDPAWVCYIAAYR